MKSRVIGILATGVLVYNAVLYKSISLAIAGCMSAALLVLASLFLVYRGRTIHVSIQVPIASAECKSPLTVRIHVQNDSFLSCPKFQCRLEQGSSFLRRKRKIWMRGQSALPGENCYDYKMRFTDYGSYRVYLKKVRVYDLTGLFYKDCSVECSAFVQVFPQMQEIGVHITETVNYFWADADVYDDFRPGNDSSELFQVRPFQNGDKIQSIHWKLSAKSDELLVKEVSQPKACPVIFLLDYKGKKQTDVRKVNAYLVILASISFSMMDAGCPHYMVWYSGLRGDVVRLRVDQEESLYLFLSCYLEETFQDGAENLLEAYREKFRGERYLHVLRLDERLEFWKNEDLLVEFTVKNWKKRLGELELVV